MRFFERKEWRITKVHCHGEDALTSTSPERGAGWQFNSVDTIDAFIQLHSLPSPGTLWPCTCRKLTVVALFPWCDCVDTTRNSTVSLSHLRHVFPPALLTTVVYSQLMQGCERLPYARARIGVGSTVIQDTSAGWNVKHSIASPRMLDI